MPTIDGLISALPEPLHRLAIKHAELIKFAVVGGTTFVVDAAIYYPLAFTVLEAKPVIARIISGVIATILSYILNREWAFKNRGGRERHHEAMLFFGISAVAVLLTAAPLWLGNNVFDMRHNLDGLDLAILDFFLAFILGNLLGMAFRFWALRRFAFPEESPKGEGGSTDPKVIDVSDEELGHA
ncbi:MAG: GtrA family protein [Gordonia sp. (in: high G+C Gram-positive bacteria)]